MRREAVEFYRNLGLHPSGMGSARPRGVTPEQMRAAADKMYEYFRDNSTDQTSIMKYIGREARNVKRSEWDKDWELMQESKKYIKRLKVKAVLAFLGSWMLAALIYYIVVCRPFEEWLNDYYRLLGF